MSDKTVIITDAVMATCSTILATLELVRQKHEKNYRSRAVASKFSIALKGSWAVDEFICMETREDFKSVRRFYINFDQVSDAAVLRIWESTADERIEQGFGLYLSPHPSIYFLFNWDGTTPYMVCRVANLTPVPVNRF